MFSLDLISSVKRMLQKVIVFALVMFLDGHYHRISPRQPDPASGRIYVHHVKTMKDVAQVYLTRTELLPSEAMFYVCPVFFLAAYFLNKRWKIFRDPNEHMPKKLS